MEQSFSIGDHEVWPGLDLVKGPAATTHLEPRVMACLELLASRTGDVVSKDEFFTSVWDGRHVADDALVHCISILRRALGDSIDSQHTIQTIPKKGYRLVVPVTDLNRNRKAASPSRSQLTLDAVLASCSDHVYVFDASHRYLCASEAGARAIGVDAAAMIGKSWQELGMPSDIMEPFHKQVASVFAGGSSARTTISYPTIYGTRCYEYILDPILEAGEVVAVVAVVRELV